MSAAAAAEWLAPDTLDAALALRAEREDATVLAGGTFVGILVNQGFIEPPALLSLARVEELRGAGGRAAASSGSARWSPTGRSSATRASARAGPRSHARSPSSPARASATRPRPAVCSRTRTTPPTRRRCCAALEARVVLRSPRREREVAVADLILGHYETCIEPDELLVEVRVPAPPDAAVYRKFRSRSSEDRPCVAVAAAPPRRPPARRRRRGRRLPAALRRRVRARRRAAAVGRAYAERIEPIDDARGSAAYRRRVTAVEVRRAIEALG